MAIYLLIFIFAERLREGVSMERILDDVPSILAPGSMEKLHFANWKDLQNIIRDFWS